MVRRRRRKKKKRKEDFLRKIIFHGNSVGPSFFWIAYILSISRINAYTLISSTNIDKPQCQLARSDVYEACLKGNETDPMFQTCISIIIFHNFNSIDLTMEFYKIVLSIYGSSF